MNLDGNLWMCWRITEYDVILVLKCEKKPIMIRIKRGMEELNEKDIFSDDIQNMEVT